MAGGAPTPTPTSTRTASSTSPAACPRRPSGSSRPGRLDERGALGTDTFGPDRGVDDTYGVSVALYDRRRISLENLTNLGALPSTGAWVLVGGPRHAAGSGSTATIFGVLPPGR